MKVYVHFVDGFFLAHVNKMQIGGHDDLGVAIRQVGFDPKVADVIELDFFLVVFNNKMFGNKSWSILVDVGSLDYLMVVVFLGLLVGMEVLRMGERVSIHRLSVEFYVLWWPGHSVGGRRFQSRWSTDLDTIIRCFGRTTSAPQFSW